LRSGCRDLTHPFGAPPTSADTPVSPQRSRGPATPVNGGAACSAATVTEDEAVVVETGARAGAADDRPALGAGALNSSSEESADLSREEFDALVARRVAEREQAMAWRTATLRAQVSERAAMVRVWPAGTRCPLGRLREAWVVHRYGLAEVVQAGAAAAGAARPELARQLGEAIGLYGVRGGLVQKTGLSAGAGRLSRPRLTSAVLLVFEAGPAGVVGCARDPLAVGEELRGDLDGGEASLAWPAALRPVVGRERDFLGDRAERDVHLVGDRPFAWFEGAPACQLVVFHRQL
jgi:hypothetical protein